MTFPYRIATGCAALLVVLSGVAANARDIWVAPTVKAVPCESAVCECSRDAPCPITDALLKELTAGDTLRLQPGLYHGFALVGLAGEAGRPITITGPGPHGEGEGAFVLGGMTASRDALEIRASTHVVVKDLAISGAKRAGIRVNNSHDVTIAQTAIRDSGVWGVFTNHSNRVIVRDNRISGAGKQHGIYHSNSGDDVEISGNIISGFQACAVHVNGDLSMGGGKGVKGDGIVSNVVIRDNLFAENGSLGGSAVNLDGVENVHIDNNLFLDNKAGAVAVFKHDGAIGSRGVTISRNLMVMATASREALIFNQSGDLNRVVNNLVIMRDPQKSVYSVNNVDVGSLPFSRIKGLPLSARGNIYAYTGDFALLNDDKAVALSRWQRAGQDEDARELSLAAVLTYARPRGWALRPEAEALLHKLEIGKDHPHRDQLPMIRE